MNENTNQNTQQQTTPTPEAAGGRMFTQEEVNRIVSDRLAREREKLADEDTYRAKYEALRKELEGIKAAQLRQTKESAYRDLLVQASINEKRLPIVMRASKAEIDALELDQAGKIVGAEKLIEGIRSDWADFVVTTEIRGAEAYYPPIGAAANVDDDIAAAFKPKI